MGALGPKGVRRYMDPKLHHADGTHRTTAPTANGRDLDQFDKAMRRHLAAHEEQQKKTA